MNQQTLNRRCVELFMNPEVQSHCWHPRTFWDTHDIDDPQPEELTEPKVDLRELEVMFAEVAHEHSVCAHELEREQPGRVARIRRVLQSGDLPFLHRSH
ncbi:MAG: hypothetical protein PHQ14_10460 [Chromatiales bacterium]|jgi:hypothetical protein|nr:hypothetical protein [Chromatiales bacterium]MDX9768371.1 hypothetical protein [Ectothiorhodospiraceae bacterium]